MHRDMVWVEKERFRGWACSECAWEFKPLEMPTGNTIAEMKQHYERQRDAEFRSHVCAEHPRPQAEHVNSSMVDSNCHPANEEGLSHIERNACPSSRMRAPTRITLLWRSQPTLDLRHGAPSDLVSLVPTEVA